MRHLLNQFINDDTGAIITAEFIILATVVILALVTGWNAVSGALVGELADIATAFGGLNQSYGYGSITAVSSNGEHAHCGGSGFIDAGNQLFITTTTNSIAGGFSTTGISTTGGFGGVSGGFEVAGGGAAAAAGSSVGVGAAAAPASMPQANITDGELITEELMGAEARGTLLNAEILESRPLFDRAVVAPQEVRSGARNLDECEELKAKIRELCQRLHEADSSAKNEQRLSPTPQSHGLTQPVQPRKPAE